MNNRTITNQLNGMALSGKDPSTAETIITNAPKALDFFKSIFGGGGESKSYDQIQREKDATRAIQYNGQSLEGRVINIYGSDKYYLVKGGRKTQISETNADNVAAQYGAYIHVPPSVLDQLPAGGLIETSSNKTNKTMLIILASGAVIVTGVVAYVIIKNKRTNKSLEGIKDKELSKLHSKKIIKTKLALTKEAA